MIALISGEIARVESDAVVVLSGGVGYRVYLPTGDLDRIGDVGDQTRLHTYLHVRDSELTLYGAVDSGALELFEVFLTVTGIGPRVALALLGAGNPENLRQSIEAEDISTLTAVPGVGKKTAQRIIFDLKGKLPEREADRDGGPADEALQALVSLGYSRREAAAALEGSDGDIEARIRHALQELAEA